MFYTLLLLTEHV